MPTYRAPVRDTKFILDEVIGLDRPGLAADIDCRLAGCRSGLGRA